MAFNTIIGRLADRKTVVGGIIIALSLAVLAGSPGFRSFLNANQGAVSAVLTLMLVVLYVGQYHLLDRQVRLENRPHLVVEEYDEKGNKIYAQLSNLGNGVSTDIELETTIGFEGGGSIEPASGRRPMRKVGEEGDEKSRVGNSLEAGRGHEMFVGDAVVGLIEDGKYQGWGLRAAIGRLAREDIETVTVDFAIVSSDLLDNEYSTTIYGAPFKVDIDGGGIGVEEVKIHGRHPWRE